jgi:hypothetical protein
MLNRILILSILFVSIVGLPSSHMTSDSDASEHLHNHIQSLGMVEGVMR